MWTHVVYQPGGLKGLSFVLFGKDYLGEYSVKHGFTLRLLESRNYSITEYINNFEPGGMKREGKL